LLAREATAYCAAAEGPGNTHAVLEGGVEVPQTIEKHETEIHDPALCELLPVRDYVDDVIVRTDGLLLPATS